MRYTIWKIDDSRKSYTDKIEQAVTLDPIYINCVNGRDPERLNKEIAYWNLPTQMYNQDFTHGELGVWFTLLNTLSTVVSLGEPVLTLEDDALLHENFMNELQVRMDFLPRDFDFFSLFIPRDHDNWSQYEPEINERGVIVDPRKNYIGSNGHKVNDIIFKPWQRYGGVSMIWTPQGAQKLLDAVYEDPYMQWDEYVYCNSRIGKLNGFTSNPRLTDLVYISGTEKSIVHE